jgi:hypothetical protein
MSHRHHGTHSRIGLGRGQPGTDLTDQGGVEQPDPAVLR